MSRGIIIAFVAGWLLWFWIDKTSFEYSRLPQPRAGQYIADFQTAVDLARSGRYATAYVFLWKAHFIVLSIGVGLLINMILDGIARALNRRKLTKLYVPHGKQGQQKE